MDDKVAVEPEMMEDVNGEEECGLARPRTRYCLGIFWFVARLLQLWIRRGFRWGISIILGNNSMMRLSNDRFA